MRYRGYHCVQTPQGATGTWVQAEGVKGGDNVLRKRRQTQAYAVGCRDEWWRLTGGGCRVCKNSSWTVLHARRGSGEWVI